MSTRELLSRLASLGVTLSVHGDALRVRAPQGALDAELQAELTRHKPELIRLLGTADGAAPAGAIPAVARDGPLPLSSSQQRLWFLDRLRPDSRAYALVTAFELEGALDVAALRASLDALVARHEILRTTFGDTGGVPWQCIAAPGPAELTLQDLGDVPAGERLAAAARWAGEWGERPFDLATGPLFRAGLLRLAPGRWVLAFALHHIVFDGWSLGVLYDELSALYAARRGGAPAQLPPLPVQFADFAAWERAALQGPALDGLLEHWRARLEGLAPLELPADRPRPARQGLNGRTLELSLPAELVDGLAALGRRQGATLYMTLLAGQLALLQRYTGDERLAVGAPVANRERTEFERLVGPCLNLLVLQTDLSGAPSFLELLERVRATTVDALAHQALPFEKLVEALAPERDPSRSPLVQVSFALHGAERAPVLEGLVARPLAVPRTTTVFDLAVDLFEQPDGLRAHFTFDTDLFDAGTIRRMAAAYHVLLEQVLADPERPVGELPLLAPDEQRAWLAQLDETAAAYPALGVQRLVELQAARTPEAVAVEGDGRRLSYAELDARANRIAHVLRECGVERGVLVGLCLDRDPDLLAGLLGILKAGGAYVPLDPDFPAARLAFMLADCQAPVLLTRRGLLEDLETRPDVVVRLDADAERIAAAPATPPPGGAGPDDLAYVIYTSGSTGQPKGVAVPHRAVVNLLTSMAQQPGLAARDVLTAVTTISFDIAALELFLPLVVGARVVLASRQVASDGPRLRRLLAESGTTVLQATPATWQLLLQSGWSDPSLECLCGGEALPRPLAERLLEAGGEVWNVYGPTETTIWSATCRVETGSGPVPIGRPIANTRLLVLDARRQPLPAGIPGELYIGGDGVARGYLGRPDLTAERFLPDPFRPHASARLYRTGDRVRQRADGALEFLGRIDSQVKLRGYRIEMGEIEAVLAEHADVGEAAVLLREDRAGDPRLVAYVTARDRSAGVSIEALRDALFARLPEYMVPAVFVTLNELPRTPNRKLDRKALPAPTGERRSSQALIPPRTACERELAAVWIELLALGEVGVRDDFFDLGGHSLLVTQLVSRLRDRLGVEVPIGRVFETPTLEGLAEWIEAQHGAGAHGSLSAPVPVTRGADLPLSFAQQRLWFLDQMGAGAAYNVPLALQLSGRLDRDALQRSLAALVERHESLRTRFRIVDGRPRQVIAPSLPLPVECVDLSSLSEPAREQELARLAVEEAERPFDLSTGPLIRARLLAVGPTEHVLLLTLHHVICDGWSLGVLFGELVELYQAHLAGRAPRLPPLAVQYADFAVWQRRELAGDALAGQLAYWKRQLGPELSALQLPTDRPRPAVQSFAGSSWRFQLSGELTEALESLARAEGVTLAMLLLGAFGALLARDSGQDDIAVGSPIANRTRSELETLIGFFANSLVLRLDLTGDPSFRALVRRVQQMSLQAYAHQDLPFERLVDELSPERSLGHNPLFQVVFAMQNAVPPQRELPELTLRPLPPTVTRTRTDLELHLHRAPRGLEGILVYSTDLFGQQTIARAARRYELLLTGAVADPSCRISRLPVLDAAERRRMLQTWNETAMPYPDGACIHELIEARAAEAPGQTALVFGSEQLTYGELNARANRVAHVLRSMGVGPDRLVGLCVERGLPMIVALLGILKAGGAYVPMDPAYPRERLAFMLRDSGVSVLVTTAALLERLPEHDTAVLCLDRDAAAIDAAPSLNPAPVGTPGNLAYAIYTSGSTGTPKCALLEHRGLCSLSEAQRRMFGVDRNSRVLQFASLSFDAATFEIVMALPQGATLVLGDRAALLPGPDLLSVLVEQRITIVTLTPTALAALPAAALPDLATITVAGEACPAELVATWAPGRRLFNLYGPTETTIWATAAQLVAGEDVHIGRPIGNVELYILDGHGQPVPVGVPGELHIGGVGLARGYLGRPELTAERFIDHPFRDRAGARLYRTGDRARFRPDGNVEFLGRIDSQVKLRGHRIELGEIEAVLNAHPAVRESLALIREDSPGNRRIVAYVVDDPEVEIAGETGEAGGEVSLAAAHVAHWQALYDDTYAGAAAAANGTFNVSGWNSSYTGQPIDREQMREWVERTVDQVTALAPRRLLEIGCGSGLLLFRLAPRCETYVGTDFSAAAIEAVGRHLPALGDAAARVQLLQRTAHDLRDLPGASFDTVLLNSVVQYFPGADYLVQAIEEALRVVGESGRIVVGDVRSLPLLSAFHASVQLHGADEDAPLEPLRRQVHALANLDQELVVHPGFFQALAERLPRIRGVEVRPKPGRYDNELSRFRYDVVLHVGTAPETAADGRWLDWRRESLDLHAVRARLVQEAPEQLGLIAIPDARTVADVAAFDLLERREGTDGPATVGELRRTLRSRVAAMSTAHPEDLVELARELGYDCWSSGLAGRADGSFDACLVRRGSAALRPAFPAACRPHVSWAACTNNPLRGRRLRELVPALRRQLAERLPDSMLPAAVVVLEAFPVTANGKLDRRALPAPDALRPELAGEYVAPQSASEETLARIWAEVLELQRVGVHDNFFELGGDSILSIQVVAAARKAGLGIRARDLFEHQTVAELARAATGVAAAEAEQGVVTGPVPLTPIQHWFLEQALEDSHHFNQALHVQANVAIEPVHLRQALAHLVAHHDVLRLQLIADGAGWSSRLTPPGDEVGLRVVELSGLTPAERERRLADEAARAQASLDPRAGVMLSAVLFTSGNAIHPSLLLVVHHLAVDAVSWPILLEDLGRALAACRQGEPVSLPAKTTSFRAWATRLTEHARSPAVALAARTWLQQPWHLAEDPPRDAPASAAEASNTVGSVARVRVALDAAATRALLREVPSAYNTRVDEALVSALARALCTWTGSDRLALDLEGHGRQEVLAGLDLSRTVGWFTSLYPVLLDVDRDAGPGSNLRSIKDQLRRIPERGFSFGLARYLSGDRRLMAQLAALPAPRVAFNYLGQFGVGRGDGSAFAFSDRPAGPMRSPRQRRLHWLEINGAVRAGTLQFEFAYSEACHRGATIRRVADDFIGELQALIEHCRSPAAGRLTASDVADFGWTEADLDDIYTDLGGPRGGSGHGAP